MSADQDGIPFELELLGGGFERRYRRMRPDVLELPWGTMDVRGVSDEELRAARHAWTSAALNEHRTAAACGLTLRALVEANAPLDLIALASRFPLDELVHTELCARVAMELGGGSSLSLPRSGFGLAPDPSLGPIARALDIVVRCFCVGEAFSLPMLRATWHVQEQALPKAVFARIVRDEAAHGTFGYAFLDWALPALDARDRDIASATAQSAVDELVAMWPKRGSTRPRSSLSWLDADAYVALAEDALEKNVLAPMRARGFTVRRAR